MQIKKGAAIKTILFIDDDKLQLKLLSTHLTTQGFSVIIAETGEKGMQIAREKKPDLIFLDVLLPGMKGRTVCAKLKSDPATKDIPIIFLTAKDSPDDVEAEMAAGALAHLTKPTDTQKLLAVVKQALGV